MEKKMKNEAIILLIAMILLITSLVIFYPLFSFHTYDKTVSSHYILNVENDHLKIQNVQVTQIENNLIVGGQIVGLKNHDVMQNGSEYTIIVELVLDDQVIESTQNITITDKLEYEIPLMQIDATLMDETTMNLSSAKVHIMQGETNISTNEADITSCIRLVGSSKEYRIENAYIADTFMQLGKIAMATDVSKYTDIAIEYRYKVDNDYEVFEKIFMPLNEYNENTDIMYYTEDKIEEFTFLDREISAVIILSNETEEYVFSIDMYPMQSEEQ